MDSDSERHSFQKISGVQSYGCEKFWSMVMKFLIFMKNDNICEIEKLTNWAQKINLRCVSDVKIHQGSALRAIFKISAKPYVCSIGGVVTDVGTWNLVMNF